MKKDVEMRRKEMTAGISVPVYLSDKDTGYAVWIVAFRVGWSKQLLAFPLLKAVQEGWIQYVLQHLYGQKKQ